MEDEKLGIEDGGEEDTKIPMDQYYPDEYDQYDEGMYCFFPRNLFLFTLIIMKYSID